MSRSLAVEYEKEECSCIKAQRGNQMKKLGKRENVRSRKEVSHEAQVSLSLYGICTWKPFFGKCSGVLRDLSRKHYEVLRPNPVCFCLAPLKMLWKGLIRQLYPKELVFRTVGKENISKHLIWAEMSMLGVCYEPLAAILDAMDYFVLPVKLAIEGPYAKLNSV